MSESPNDRYSRVQQMIVSEHETWDLSPNDVAALRHVLGMVNWLADELSQYHGSTVPEILKQAHREVAKIQDSIRQKSSDAK